jgi:hypothetical protein
VNETGTCRGELEDVRILLERHRVWSNARAIKGLYQETMPATTLPSIALLHLDSDWYDSTMTCLNYLWPHVSTGGMVQFDDYGTWAGCRKAVDEFLGGRIQLHNIDGTGVWLQKP